MVVHVLPSNISTRTSTSVIVNLKTSKLDLLAGQPIRLRRRSIAVRVANPPILAPPVLSGSSRRQAWLGQPAGACPPEPVCATGR